MNLTIVTPPPFEPVTLAEVYAHLRLDAEGSPATHPDDAMLTRHIATARAWVEQATRRALVLQTLRMSCSGFPASVSTFYGYSTTRQTVDPLRLYLHRPPLVAVDAVSYYDADNALQTVDAASYYTTDDQLPELRFTSSFSTPTVYSRPDAVRVQYRAGYTADGSPPETQADYAANVPQGLKDAILLGVQMLYDSLTPADLDRIERTREAIIQPYRIQLAP